MAHKSKTPSAGNLRDFRIDAQGQKVPQADSQRSAPQQKIAPRQSTMKEWTYSNSPMAVENLWAEWNEELKPKGEVSEINLAHAASENPRGHVRPSQVGVSTSSSSQLAAATKHSKSVPSEGALLSENFHKLPWAARLAMDERLMEKEGQVDFSSNYQKQEMLRARTKEFAQSLQDSFREQIEVFNESRKSPAHMIHIYKVSNAEGDFMLFRNGVKLVVSAQQSGRVIFAFNQFMGQIYAPTHNPVIEIEAAWGAFDQLFWSYRGERLLPHDLVRYFFTEFVKQSYR